MLTFKNVSVSVQNKLVVKNFSAFLAPAQVVACLGPNGSGKSSFLYALMGHPDYSLVEGQVLLDGECINEWSVDKRARAGLFLSIQQPFEIPGVSLRTLLKDAFYIQHGADATDLYVDRLTQALNLLKLPLELLDRGVHAGLSGGEKKITEMLQLLVLRPKYVFLDEIDSGLDVDALRSVVKALKAFLKVSPESSLWLVTHYGKLLDDIVPCKVYVLNQGSLVHEGDAQVARKIQDNGYQSFI